jgi:phosphatidylserine/phosphatidylglycerophosphate/cardiolipin synthase-like enzyme
MAIAYNPLKREETSNLKGAALVGTHSVIIGWDLKDAADRVGLHGFAIRRKDLDPATGELLRLQWLGGYKRFKSTDDGRATDVSSLEGPFQRFRWNEYTLKQNREYIYEVYPMRGDPGALVRDGEPLTFNIRPSAEDAENLGVYVNRGVTAAPAYLRRFNNLHPRQVEDNKAFKWLSRGLKESLLEFIGQAQAGEALHIAIYELHDHEVARAIKDAIDNLVDVHIVHSAVEGKTATKKNEKVIQEFSLQNHRTKRTEINISHNKVVIHLVNGTPQKVWTGSANFSENAFYFQTNTALIIRDPETMQYFEEYFQVLKTNPSRKECKLANRAIMDRANALTNGFAEKTFFSPISKREILETSVELIKSAESAVLISAPYGVEKTMINAFETNSADIVEYGLVNSTAKKKIAKFQKRCTRFFTPTKMLTYLGRKWDAKAFGNHKIHAKTLIIDPYGDNPKVLIGSANFSVPSCNANDENALLISGDKRLTAILTTEFMRMFDHYKARFYIDRTNKENEKIIKENEALEAQGLPLKKLKTIPMHLDENGNWSNTAFKSDANSHKFRDRTVFSGGK